MSISFAKSSKILWLERSYIGFVEIVFNAELMRAQNAVSRNIFPFSVER